MNLLEILSAKSNDEEIVNYFKDIDIKSFSKTELQYVYCAITEKNDWNFKSKNLNTKTKVLECIKSNLRACSRGLSFAEIKLSDSKEILNSIKSYLQ